MTDIVERLKRSIRELERLPLHTQMLQEAADEIEALRADLDRAAKLAYSAVRAERGGDRDFYRLT